LYPEDIRMLNHHTIIISNGNSVQTHIKLPANISSLKFIIFEALLMPPLVMWNILSNISGWP
jgi:hypothetical protein